MVVASRFLRGRWGGIGGELRASNKIKTARPARTHHHKQKSKGRVNPNKKTHQTLRFNPGAGCRT